MKDRAKRQDIIVRFRWCEADKSKNKRHESHFGNQDSFLLSPVINKPSDASKAIKPSPQIDYQLQVRVIYSIRLSADCDRMNIHNYTWERLNLLTLDGGRSGNIIGAPLFPCTVEVRFAQQLDRRVMKTSREDDDSVRQDFISSFDELMARAASFN